MNPSTHQTPVSAPSGQRSAYIDTLRGLAIFGVVCIHFGGSFVTVAGAWTPSFYLGLFFGQIFNFAVPLFIFLSGVLAGASTKRISLGAYYHGRLARIGLPYLAASAASFYLLNHYPDWQALPNLGARLTWLAQRLCYYGVEPTLYFIPLILQMYLLQPALKALPDWILQATNRLAGGRLRHEQVVLGLAVLFLALHITLGILCYRGILSYYDWCRPCPLFWLFYFFSGLHFRALQSFFPRRRLLILAALGLMIALGAMVSDGLYLTDRHAVGASFEFNNTDFAYARPQLQIFDLAMVGVLSIGIALGWVWRASGLSFLGQYTLEIYLWHILLLYEGAWRHFAVLESCRQTPELILMIAASACIIIALIKHNFTVFAGFLRQYRLVVVKQPW